MTIIDQLKRDEGLKLKLYKDTVGKWTIGVGRNLDDDGISEAEADYMLGNDVYKHRQDLLKYVPWTATIDDARFGALLNMTFNMGITRLLTFRNMLAAGERGDWPAVEEAALDSIWATQDGDRAKRLGLQFRNGIWQ